MLRFVYLVKAWLRCHWETARDHAHPEVMLHEACSQVMAEKAVAWIRHAGYNL